MGLPRIAALLDDLSRNRDSQLRFQPVDQSERQRLAQQAQEVQRFRTQRQTLETNAAGGPSTTVVKDFTPANVRLPSSPIVASPGDDLGKDQVPPEMYEAPKPEPMVEPKPRASRSADQPQPQAIKTVSDDYKRAKAEFQKKLENHLNELDPKINRVREKGRDLQTAAKADWDQKMAELDVKMDIARAKLAVVVRSSPNSWKDFQKEAETASDDLDRAFDQASR